jgi:hypothetical protein
MANPNYAFDLTRRTKGVVFAAKMDQFAGAIPGLPDYWQCAATDEADAMRQALKAAEREWPAVPGRKFNDFVVRFVSPADLHPAAGMAPAVHSAATEAAE